MKIAVSNLAWMPSEDEQAFALLKELEIPAVELAPTKYLPDLEAVSEEQAQALKQRLSAAGLETVAFQALLFGRPDLKVFDSDPTVVDKTIDYLDRVAWLASQLGAKVLVFGSPKNRRKPDGLDRDETKRAYTNFFWKAADRCAKHGVTLALEANPVAYGCNFATSTAKAARVVRETEHDNFRLHLDLGGMVLNGEDIQETVSEHKDLICHFHISEPEIKPINPDNPNHSVAAAALKSVGYQGWCSIEMLPPHESGPQLREVLTFVKETYVG